MSRFPTFLFVLLITGSSVSKGDELPEKWTFEALKQEIESIHERTSSASMSSEIDAALRLVDRGELMLLAGRVENATAIVTELRLHIEVLELALTLEVLAESSARGAAELEKKRQVLAKLKRRLAEEGASSSSRENSK